VRPQNTHRRDYTGRTLRYAPTAFSAHRPSPHLSALRLLCELCAFIAKRRKNVQCSKFKVPFNTQRFPAPQGEGPGVGSVISRFQPYTIKPMNSNLSSNIVQRSTLIAQRSTFPAPQGEGPGVGSVISRFQSCTIKPMNSNLSSNVVQRSTLIAQRSTLSPLCPPSPL